MTPDLTVCRIAPRRGGNAVEMLWGEQFAGVVGSDRWSAYSRFPAERRALCSAHLKRDGQALVDRGGDAERIGGWGAGGNRAVVCVVASVSGRGVRPPGVATSAGAARGMAGAVAAARAQTPDREAVALCRELDTWWAALWTFSRMEGVEPANNAAERALRPAVLWRQGSVGSDSAGGRRLQSGGAL